MSAPTRDELRASILRRHPCYCEDACRCTAGHVERDLDALLAAERDRVLAVLLDAGVINALIRDATADAMSVPL